MSYFLFAETAFTHEGDFEYLIKQIKEIKESGAEGVKFQVLIEPASFMSSKHSAFDQVSKWCFNYKQWQQIFNFARSIDLKIVHMPLDAQAVNLAEEFDVYGIEIHSVSFFDQGLLQKVAQVDSPVILGTGGRTLKEIDAAVEFYSGHEIILMVGYQAFPSELSEVKMTRIAALKNRFPSAAIGYADHSSFSNEYGITSFEYAYLLGATVMEKHVILEEGIKRTDYEAAVCCKKLFLINQRLKYLDSFTTIPKANIFTIENSEIKYRNRQKMIVTSRDLEVSSTVAAKDLCLKVVEEHEHGYARYEDVVGKKTKNFIAKDELVTAKDVES